MKFDITVAMVGFATIEAETKEEAMAIAEEIGTDCFDWANYEITDCSESEEE